jgi:hypothetical protein
MTRRNKRNEGNGLEMQWEPRSVEIKRRRMKEGHERNGGTEWKAVN